MPPGLNQSRGLCIHHILTGADRRTIYAVDVLVLILLMLLLSQFK
jgi:hypothetical protein